MINYKYTRGGFTMNDTLTDETFTIIDTIYNDLKQQQADPDILAILMKAAKSLNNNMPAQIVAAKTINTFTVTALTKKLSFDQLTNDELSKLKKIARAGGYRWSAAGLGDLRNQFD